MEESEGTVPTIIVLDDDFGIPVGAESNEGASKFHPLVYKEEMAASCTPTDFGGYP
jgi:hypothetical protein